MCSNYHTYFDVRQHKRFSYSKYDIGKKLTVVKWSMLDDIIAVVTSSEYIWGDTMAGLSVSERKKGQTIEATGKVTIIDFWTAKPGSMESFKIQEISIKLICSAHSEILSSEIKNSR